MRASRRQDREGKGKTRQWVVVMVTVVFEEKKRADSET
jgi:hypothetical protein